MSYFLCFMVDFSEKIQKFDSSAEHVLCVAKLTTACFKLQNCQPLPSYVNPLISLCLYIGGFDQFLLDEIKQNRSGEQENLNFRRFHKQRALYLPYTNFIWFVVAA